DLLPEHDETRVRELTRHDDDRDRLARVRSLRRERDAVRTDRERFVGDGARAHRRAVVAPGVAARDGDEREVAFVGRGDFDWMRADGGRGFGGRGRCGGRGRRRYGRRGRRRRRCGDGRRGRGGGRHGGRGGRG